MRNVAQKVLEKIKHFLFNNFFFSKIVPFMRKCGKIWESPASHIRQYKMAHALCMLDN